MAGRRGRASGGRARSRSRRDDYDDDYEDDAPRGGYRRTNKGPNMALIVGSAVGLVALLAIGGFVMSSVAESRARAEREAREDVERAKREIEEKQAAIAEAASRREEEKMKREGPWKKALEKILPGLKRWMNKQNNVKRIIGTFGFENDRATFNFKIRPKWREVDAEERSATVTDLCNKVEELCAQGFDHAAADKWPMADENKAIIIHFWDPPADDTNKKDMGREVATWKNGSLSFK